MSVIQYPNQDSLIQQLNLEQHIEGGWFRQTYKSKTVLCSDKLQSPENNRQSQRSILTSIYYLLSKESPIGHFHKNKSDIVHYFHLGEVITYFLIWPDGTLEKHSMGPDVAKGQVMQLVVPGGVWKASKIESQQLCGYGLIGESVAPGFEYEDMQLAEQELLCAEFPHHSALIKELTRD